MSIARKSKYHCDIRASFATAFRNWRRRNDIPLKQVASDLGLSIATINKWERGERFPSGHNFEMLADYTGEPPCRLFCIMANQCIPADCLLAKEKQT
jgi:transcriptional regulator with XRE-family HTH domain